MGVKLVTLPKSGFSSIVILSEIFVLLELKMWYFFSYSFAYFICLALWSFLFVVSKDILFDMMSCISKFSY